jgi:hypothetical protein
VWGFGAWGLAPNPQSPIPNPQFIINLILFLFNYYE